jgi:hypothetical protein
MHSVAKTFGPGSRALSGFLGLSVIGLAVAVFATSMDVGGVVDWAERIFGVVFIVMFAGMVYTALLAIVQVRNISPYSSGYRSWFETGIQSANGIATLALTYTLLGISLGIGSLATQTLSPETIQDVIRGLTAHFSMAFMSTVVGLPVSAALRAVLLITRSRVEESQHVLVHRPNESQ